MSNHVTIIAEAGVNHNGYIHLAKKMIDVAKECGVDYIKFQTGNTKLIMSKHAMMADYQKKNIGVNGSQQEMFDKYFGDMKAEDIVQLKQYSDDINIKCISTPFDLPSIDLLYSLNIDFWKIPSGEITNYPYLVKIAQTHMPIVMSTGMCEMNEIREALNVLIKNGCKIEDITLLHCNTEYPTPFEDVNLKAMITMGNEFGVRIGYSDHTRGIEVPVAAVALGATVIEKHFTLDRTMKGPDHIASLEPNELKLMVDSIRNIEKALGSGKKEVTDSERKNIVVARKSIIALRDIKKGEILTSENITAKRPGSGLSPMLWEKVIGTKAIKDFNEDDFIEI